MITKHFKVKLLGLSRDYRTNRWLITCLKCNKSYEPLTTMFSNQTVECPKCEIKETINYNNYDNRNFR